MKIKYKVTIEADRGKREPLVGYFYKKKDAIKASMKASKELNKVCWITWLQPKAAFIHPEDEYMLNGEVGTTKRFKHVHQI